jgi:CRISPR-associated protein Cas6/Cse3/CasE subtype I-E
MLTKSDYLSSEDNALPGWLHKEVWRFFSVPNEEIPRDFSFANFGDAVYCISKRLPMIVDPWIGQTKPMFTEFEQGAKFKFRSILDPLVTIRISEGIYKKVSLYSVKKDLSHNQKFMGWFGSKENIHGFSVNVLKITSIKNSTFNHKTGPIRVSMSDIEGILEIKDPAIFLKNMTRGIGKNQSYGCGMILPYERIKD